MACAAEHWFVLDYALRHCSWVPEDRFGYSGWQAGKDDIFNRLTVLPDIVQDWLWQKFPYTPSVIAFGLQHIRRDWQQGRWRTAALKLALLSHYLADIVAVSHTWLDFFGDEVDFALGAFKHFHDTVENRVANLLPTLIVPPPALEGDFATIFRKAVRRAYDLGQAVFNAYFDSLQQVAPAPTAEPITPPLEPLNDLQQEGVANACYAVWALWEKGVRDGGAGLPFDEDDVKRWTLKPLMECDGEEIEEQVLSPERIAEWQKLQGWTGSDIFRDHERCSPEAVAEFVRWQQKRDQWRKEEMADLLPPRPASLIHAHWRPNSGEQ